MSCCQFTYEFSRKRKEERKKKLYQGLIVGDSRKQGKAQIKCTLGDSQLGSPGLHSVCAPFLQVTTSKLSSRHIQAQLDFE